MNDDWWDRIFRFDDYDQLLGLVQNSLIAAAILGIVGGVVGVFIMQRDMPFAVHGIAEISFAGAAGALLLGASVVVGSLIGSIVAAVSIGLLGSRARDRNSAVGVLMPFGLGLGILFLALYEGRASSKFGLLTGQIISVDGPSLGWLIMICAIALVLLMAIWRPLVFDTLDPDAAAARGVPSLVISLAFMVVLGMVVSVAVQIVGALLVLAVLVVPAASALYVSSSPVVVPLLSAAFGVLATVGGILLALGGALPISPYITTISFVIYLVCRLIERSRSIRPARVVATG